MKILQMNKQAYKALSFLCGIVLVMILIYSNSWSGNWHFDDHANLGQLAEVFSNGVINWRAAYEFVFTGDAGPLGRPISLASFLIDGSAWPIEPRAFFYTNTLLHLLNGLLLCGLWLTVVRQTNKQNTQAEWIALVASALWLMQPLLASGMLMAVQRMTVLSSSFMLLGAWLYVLGRERLHKSPVAGWLLIIFGLGGGTVLGVFTKEQAAILPLLLWVLERWVLTPPQLRGKEQKLWLGFKVVAFYLPALAIALYLGRILVNYQGSFAGRDFNLQERLWTEGIILWDYLRLVILPRAFEFGPFHEDYQIHNASLLAIIALVAWIVVFGVCFALRHKTRWPLFGLLWYLVAHLIESTVVPLELYFEHRNYIAIAGPLLAVVALSRQWAQKSPGRRYVVMAGFSLYAMLLLFVLWQVTSMFGQPRVAARLWYEQHPTSVRAAQYLASELSDAGDIEGALQVLDEISDAQVLTGATRLQALQLACVLDKPHAELKQRLALVLSELPNAGKRFSINDPLSRIKLLMERKNCGGFFDLAKLELIAMTALESPAFIAQPREQSNIHFFISTLYIDARNLGMSMHHMETAMQAEPQLITLQNMVGLLESAGLYQEALELFEQYPVRWPKNPILRNKQQQEWQELKSRVSLKANQE